MRNGLAYPCGCSRKDIEETWAARGVEPTRHSAMPYPGTCRDWQQYQDPDAVLSQVPALSATPAGKNKAIHAIDGHALQGGLSLRSLQQANQIAQWIKQGS